MAPRPLTSVSSCSVESIRIGYLNQRSGRSWEHGCRPVAEVECAGHRAHRRRSHPVVSTRGRRGDAFGERAQRPRWPGAETGVCLERLALVVGRHRPWAVSAGDPARRPLPHRRPSWPRRHGRGLSRRRSQAGAAGRAQVPAPGSRSRSRPADAAAQRSADGASGLASERLPRLRHRRGRRPHLPLDGVRGRRGAGVAAPPHRPVPGGARARDVARRSARAWPPRTSAASSIAISSRPT